MPLRPMFDSEAMSTGSGLSLSKDLESDVTIINLHLSLIGLANALPIRAKREKMNGSR